MVVIKLYEQQIKFYYTHYVLNVQLRLLLPESEKSVIKFNVTVTIMCNTFVYLLMQQYQYLVSLVSYSI